MTRAWLKWAEAKDLPNRIMAHAIKAKTSPPLTAAEAIEAASIALNELKAQHPGSWDPQPGLSILRALGKATQDRDMALLAHTEAGVPTGTG